MSIPAVSIIMPVYNCSSYISEAVESILNQTFDDFELIIIDDHSTDETLKLIHGYHDPRIRLIEKQTKTGLVESLNKGLSLAKGRYVARMDGDDVSDITRLEKQVDFLDNHPNIVLCGTAYQLTDTQAKVTYPPDHASIKVALLEYCPIGHPTVMFRNSFLIQHNLTYDKGFEGAEDYELWTRLVWLGEICNMPDVLLTYRSHQEQYSNSNKHNQVKHSNLSRINMLGKLWAAASETDPYTRELLFQDQSIASAAKLQEIIAWMADITSTNKQTNCYDPLIFNSYISAKKKSTVRRFYLHQTNYKPKVLYNFIKHGKHYKGCFTTLEQMKFVAKCLFFWK